MPLNIIRQDIRKIDVDAIVSPTGQSRNFIGGVEKLLFDSGNEAYKNAVMSMPPLRISEVHVTSGFNLLSKNIIHARGPVYVDGQYDESELLESTYMNVLTESKRRLYNHIAIPLISTGTFGFPVKESLMIATKTIQNFLAFEDMIIDLVLYDEEVFLTSQSLFEDVIDYMNCHITNAHEQIFEKSIAFSDTYMQSASIEELFQEMEETFSEMLLRLIDERQLKDSIVYKKANIDRRLFSKIRSQKHYQPKKETAISFAIALELSLEDTLDFLARAGYTLSQSQKFDVVIQYFIENEHYNIYDINMLLFDLNEKTLGA
ncbi:MAG: macro domain-containing protein [Clostridia bacterium]|nr:macro domain-containing protein [Clostridia bacterium]